MIVVDCSAVVDALSGSAGTETRPARMIEDDLHAPHLLDHEVVSALRGLLRRGAIGPGRAAEVLTDYESLPVERWPAADALRRRAMQLRENVSAYDAAYVVLAEAMDCPLSTRSTGHEVRIELL